MYDERKEEIVSIVLGVVFIIAFLLSFYTSNKTHIEITPEDAYQPVHVEENEENVKEN